MDRVVRTCADMSMASPVVWLICVFSCFEACSGLAGLINLVAGLPCQELKSADVGTVSGSGTTPRQRGT